VPAVAQAIEAAKDDEATAEAAPAKNPAAAAWITVLVIGGLAVALIVTMAFSATNTGQSVNGRTATSWSPEPND
jgi:CHASE3 domain sensor protein